MPAFIIAIQILLSALAPTGQKEENPAISFTEHTIKLGDIYPGQRYERVFKYKNTGSAPLIITDIETSCGCTVVNYSKEPVMPGKEGEVKVDFIPKEQLGFTSKSFIITSNAKNSPEYIYLQGNVIAKKKNKK